MNKWFLARVGLMAWSFIVMVLTSPPEQTSDRPAVFGLPEAMVFGLVAGLVVTLLVIGFQAFNPMNHGNWRYPSWFRRGFGGFLQIFHDGGFTAIALGLGGVVRAIVMSEPLFNALGLTAAGAGIVAGVVASTKLFQAKMDPFGEWGEVE